MKRLLLGGLALLISVPILYFCASLVGAVIPGPRAAIAGEPSVKIALARGPVHYDILLPATTALRQRFAFAFRDGVPVFDPSVRYLMVGWGSRGFYTTAGTWADVAWRDTFRAVTGDKAALHVDVAGDLTGVPNLAWLTLSQAQTDALADTILATLELDASGTPIFLNARYGPTDAFYAATGHFTILHTCNVWLSETLRSAGVPFGIWPPLPQAVDLSLWLRR